MRQADEDRFREFARNQSLLLRRCAYLLCGDWHLAEERSGEVPDAPDPTVDPALVHHSSSVRAALLDALATLAPRQRAVLVLRYFAGMSIAETAVALGCSDGTVKSQASRGLDALRAGFPVLDGSDLR